MGPWSKQLCWTEKSRSTRECGVRLPERAPRKRRTRQHDERDKRQRICPVRFTSPQPPLSFALSIAVAFQQPARPAGPTGKVLSPAYFFQGTTWRARSTGRLGRLERQRLEACKTNAWDKHVLGRQGGKNGSRQATGSAASSCAGVCPMLASLARRVLCTSRNLRRSRSVSIRQQDKP